MSSLSEVKKERPVIILRYKVPLTIRSDGSFLLMFRS